MQLIPMFSWLRWIAVGEYLSISKWYRLGGSVSPKVELKHLRPKLSLTAVDIRLLVNIKIHIRLKISRGLSQSIYLQGNHRD